MKILFLDIDGVMIPSLQLNPPRIETSFGVFDSFDEKCVHALNDIYFATQCQIVISSDWTANNIKSLGKFREFFKANKVIAPVIGFTTKLKSKATELERTREKEIDAWVRTHNPESWVAVDDYELTGLDPNFVWCKDDQLGLSEEKVKIGIITKLNQ